MTELSAYTYPGDKKIADLLQKSGAEFSIFAVYGLFYGCLAAPHTMTPSQYLPMIFEKQGSLPEGEAKVLLGSLMALWNTLADLKPETDQFILPATKYPKTPEGLLQRATDDTVFIEHFMEGLALGETKDEDLTDGAHQALESLANILNNLVHLREGLEAKEDGIYSAEAWELFDKVEDTISDAIAQANLGLKRAREQAAAFQVAGTQAAPNDFCPCGSGRKYKKCCGLTH